MSTPLEKAIQHCHGQTALAAKIRAWHHTKGEVCRVEQGHIWGWLNNQNHRIPLEHVIAVSWATDWTLSPHEINDLYYPHPEDGLPEHLRSAA
jgi:hypothetical protein